MGVDELGIWYNSLRTRYTKLKMKKSRDGAPAYSDRDQWVLNNFYFLAPFTYEVNKRTIVSLKSKLLSPAVTDTDPDPIDVEDVNSLSGPMKCQMSDSQQQSSLPHSTTTTRHSSHKPNDILSSAISGKMDQFMEMQNRLIQQMVRPDTDRMKEAFIYYVRESVHEIHPTLWEEMHRDIMKTVLMFKDKDSEVKKGQERTATSEPFWSSTGWQQTPYMWSPYMQNPGSVLGTTESAWTQQQHPQHQQFSQQQQQPPQNFFQSQQQICPRQQRPQDKEQDSPLLNASHFTPMASTPVSNQSPNTSFPSGFGSYLDEPSPDQQQGQPRNVQQMEPQQP